MANQLYQGDNPLATTCPNVVDNLTSTSSTDALSAKQGKVLNDKVSGMKIRSGIKTNLNFTANTQAEIEVAIPNSPFLGGDYAISVDFEFYGSSNTFTHIIRNSYSSGFVVRATASATVSGVKMFWTAVGVS